MSVIREYIEQVVTELARDEKFIRHLKTVKSRQYAGVADIEKFVGEWLVTQKGLTPVEVRLAHRLAVDKFPELLDKARNDITAAKKALFSLLTGALIEPA